jgi:hypothetical protein
MSQVITTRNNKQSGGTYVSIKQTDEFKTSEDNNLILTSLLKGCESINCINVSSVNSIVFDCVLYPNGNIRIYNERSPGQPIPKICIKISFIRTPETDINVKYIEFQFEESTIYDKSIKTADELDKEGSTQKQMFDSLLPILSRNITPDTIAMGIVKPADFEKFVTTIFEKSIEEELATKDKNPLTVKVIQWIIEQANIHKLDLHLFFMDLFEGDEQFLQIVESLTDQTELEGNEIRSVQVFHDSGYYNDVYKIVEFVGAYIISILEITGVWNYDLTLRNIMVNPDDKSAIKFIDFGYNKNLKNPVVREEIIGIFRQFYSGFQSIYIQKFMLIPDKEQFMIGGPNGIDTAVIAFTQSYDEIIMNLSSNIQKLLKPDSTEESKLKSEKSTKRQIVFKILMFLAFIDGLIQKQTFGGNSFQCKDIMEFMFNCKIFDNFATFVKYSSLDYHTFLEKNRFKSEFEIEFKREFKSKLLLIISELIPDRYTMLCNIILDSICIRIAGLFSKSAKERYTSSVGSSEGSSEGGKGISKKRYPRLRKSTRRPLWRKSGTKRLRRRRRSSRK